MRLTSRWPGRAICPVIFCWRLRLQSSRALMLALFAPSTVAFRLPPLNISNLERLSMQVA
jgi:hypothetical protein